MRDGVEAKFVQQLRVDIRLMGGLFCAGVIARFSVDRRIVVEPSAMSLETATQECLVGFHDATEQPQSDPSQTP